MWVSRLTNTFNTQPSLEDVDPGVLFGTWYEARDPSSWRDKQSVKAVKKWLPAFSVGIWAEGYTRGSDGLLGTSGVVLEFEDGSRIEDVLALLAGYRFYFYTSFQHAPEAPRFRVVLPFAEPVSLEQHLATWDEVAALCRGRGYDPDPTCREPSRLYYLPSRTPSRADTHFALAWEEGTSYITPPAPVQAAPAPLQVDQSGEVLLTWATSRKVSVDALDATCAFSRHARDAAAHLPEPEWRAAISLWLRCDGGVDLVHERSKPYAGYTRSETQAKILALQDVGSFSCGTIRSLSAACRGCTHTCTQVLDMVAPPPPPPPEELAVERKALTLEQAQAWLTRAHAAEQEATAALVEASEQLRRVRSVGSPDERRAASEQKVLADQHLRSVKLEAKAAERALRQASVTSQAPVPAPVGADPTVWNTLSFDLRAMAPKATKGNVRLVLTRDPAYAGKYRWNEFAMSPMFDGKESSDTQDTNVATDLEYRYQIAVPTAYVREVSVAIAMEHSYHPVRDWLGSLKWDGQDRLSDLLSKGFGAIEDANDPTIMAELSAIFLISVVARVFVPGEKVDTMLILTGRQNVAKSSTFRALVSPPCAPRLGWFGDAKLQNLGNKDTAQLLLGKLLWEVAELGSSWRNADARDRKQWLSQQEDRYRPPYGHRPIDVPRQCVVVGTTNDDTFLTDPTGNRRYLCVAVGSVDIEWVRANRDQLFAQAVVEYHAGRRYWVDATFQPRLERHNARFSEPDLWVYVVEAWLRKHNKRSVTLEQVLQMALGLDAIGVKPQDASRARDVLRVIGCQRDLDEQQRQVGWIVPDNLLTQVEEVVTHHNIDNVLPMRRPPARSGVSGMAGGRG